MVEIQSFFPSIGLHFLHSLTLLDPLLDQVHHHLPHHNMPIIRTLGALSKSIFN